MQMCGLSFGRDPQRDMTRRRSIPYLGRVAVGSVSEVAGRSTHASARIPRAEALVLRQAAGLGAHEGSCAACAGVGGSGTLGVGHASSTVHVKELAASHKCRHTGAKCALRGVCVWDTK